MATKGLASRKFSYVHVPEDGAKGDRGPALRGPMYWVDCPVNFQFQCGGKNDDYIDIVVYNDAWYMCQSSHLKTSSNPPGSTADNAQHLWVAAAKLPFVAVKILLSEYALIKNLGAEAIEMKDPNGNIIFEAKEGKVTCNIGNFKNINISGNSTFKGFILKEKTIITSANYGSMSKTVEFYAGETHTELDLIKTGNWIYVASLPTQTSNYTLRLPCIRHDVAYTEAYRDYVRQFLGNEVVIYNYSGQTIYVDSGESSRIIKHNRAEHFKLSFTPIQVGETYLERLVWQFAEPYQF